MLSTCARCNWVLNAPLSRHALHELIRGAGYWLRCVGVKDVKDLELRVWRNIKSFKNFINGCAGNYRVCRHCVMEVFSLMIDNEFIRDEFKDLFLNAYDFDSIIY